MEITGIDQLGRTAPSLYTKDTPGEMDQTDFLSLLTAQLQHQDPLNPQDPTEFTSQLTEFSNLEQLIGLGDSMKTLIDGIESMQVMQQLATNTTQALGLIGNDVLYESETINVGGGEAAPVTFYSEEPLTNVQAKVKYYDSETYAGGTRLISIGDTASGIRTVNWDGLTSDGHTLADGAYEVTIQGTKPDGTVVNLSPLGRERITGVVFEDGQNWLETVSGERVALDGIYGVLDAA